MLSNLRRSLVPRGTDGAPGPSAAAVTVTVGLSISVVTIILIWHRHNESLAGEALLGILSVALLALAMSRTIGPHTWPPRRRMVWSALPVLVLASAFAVGVLALSVGEPATTTALASPGARAVIPSGLAGRDVIVKARGTVADGSDDTVAFSLADVELEIGGRLTRVNRHVIIGAKHVRAVDADAVSFHRIRLPGAAQALTLTRLVGRLDGPLVVSIAPDRVPRRLVVALAILAVITAGLAEAALGLRVYAAAIGAGAGAGTFVATWAMPEAPMAMAASATFAGAFAGMFAGMTAAHASRTLLARLARSRARAKKAGRADRRSRR